MAGPTTIEADQSATAFGNLPRLARLDIVLLAGAVAALTFRLWPEWQRNADLSHGFFMPIVFLVLLHESRRGPARYLQQTNTARLAFTVLVVLGLGTLMAAGLYAAAVDWSHPLVNLSLTATLVLFLAAGLLVLSDDSLRFVRCNWSAWVAIALWLLCTPIPPGTYTRLTLALQLWISEGVLRTLHLLGIAAVRHGNIIELAQATVGVEEACSGIRSLISCVFAGLFFSAAIVRRPWARGLIIGLAVPLALAMNFLRSLTLTLLANSGIDISGRWHDLTGFAVLGATAAILAGLAVLLSHHPGPLDISLPVPNTSKPFGRLSLLIGALGIAAVLVFVAIANTKPSVRRDSPTPDLNRLLPSTVPGWEVFTSNDLFQFRDTLQTEHLAQRIYRKTLADGQSVQIILYVAYWHAGQAPVSLVASHTPDACWPGSGWIAQKTARTRAELVVGGRQIPPAEYRLFSQANFPQYVWFWHLYDGRPITYRDPYSAVELLRIAWKYGFRHDGDQLFVRVSSNQPWPEIAHEPLIADFFKRMHQYGL